MSAPRQLTRTAAALALAACASGAFAQADDGAALRDVAAVKASSGIAPQVFAKLEAFRPATPPRLQGTLHRVVLKRVITRDGKDAGTDRRTIEFLPGAPGYMFETATSPELTTAFLTYGPFVTVQSHATKHLKQTFPHLDIDTTSTNKLSDVTLPPSFDAAMTPRAVWQTVSENDTAITSKNVIKSIDRSSFGILKRTCATSERQPASVVAPALFGTVVFITCQQPDKPDEELSLVYLDDYGVFFPVNQVFKLAPQGIRVANAYTVERVDVDAPPAGALTAQVRAPTGAALPTYAESLAAYRRHDDATAFANFTALAATGEPRSEMMLALLYHEGKGTPVDMAMAATWMRRAAEQGLALAQVELALRYRDGTGVPIDNQAAFGWSMKAAQQGNADAQSMVGIDYSGGIGVARDIQAALEWTSKAAAQGNLDGEANLGVLYSGGMGIPADFDKAALWTRRAADRGSVLAQTQLGMLYGHGKGVPQDIDLADFWSVLASKGGSSLAAANRVKLESVMDAARKARIQAKADAWRPVDAAKPATP
jgi:TPR repeat protein